MGFVMVREQQERNQFIRLANAILKERFPFAPQRAAMVGVLWRRHIENQDK
jgi:hypothetical protein